MSNVYGSHPGGCERQTRCSLSVSQLSVSFVYDFRCAFVLLAISKGFNVFSKKGGSFILDLDAVGVQFEVL